MKVSEAAGIFCKSNYVLLIFRILCYLYIQDGKPQA